MEKYSDKTFPEETLLQEMRRRFKESKIATSRDIKQVVEYMGIEVADYSMNSFELWDLPGKQMNDDKCRDILRRLEEVGFKVEWRKPCNSSRISWAAEGKAIDEQ